MREIVCTLDTVSDQRVSFGVYCSVRETFVRTATLRIFFF